MAVSIEKLYNKSWITDRNKLLFLIMYTPMGTLLLTLRIFMSLQLILACMVLPQGSTIRKFVLRVFYCVMGLFVIEKNKIPKTAEKIEKPRLVITNHITPFDHVAFSLVEPCCAIKVYKMGGIISSVLGYKDFGVSQGKENTKRNILSYLNSDGSLPVVLHPEGATTNGQIALMKYSNWAFEMENRVLAIGLQVKRFPFLPIAPSVLGASWVLDLIFMLYSPITIFTINYVGYVTKQSDETAENFAKKVQMETAKILNLEVTNYSVGDKMEFMKRRAREEAIAANPMNSVEIQNMALRVREVLPHVPMDIIKRDLVRTRSVDATVANILEGNVPDFTPIQQVAPQPSDPINVAASNFGQSSSERTNSLQDRKNQLIETARRKYIAKHKLEIPGYTY